MCFDGIRGRLESIAIAIGDDEIQNQLYNISNELNDPNLALTEALLVAENLPEGYEIEFSVSNEDAMIKLCDDEEETVSHDEFLQFTDLIEYACKHAAGEVEDEH